MKLKQRVLIVSGSLSLLVTLCFIGVLLNGEIGERPAGEEGRQRPRPRVNLPNIPGVPDYVVDERVNNPGNKDPKAVAESIMARYNRSKGVPVPADQRQALAGKREHQNAADVAGQPLPQLHHSDSPPGTVGRFL